MTQLPSRLSIASISLLSTFALVLACGGSEDNSTGDGDGDSATSGDGDSGGDGDGTTSGDGDGTEPGDGDGSGGGDSASGGTSGGDGDGDRGSGGSDATGPCYDEPCQGNCVPAGDSRTLCEGTWECQNVFVCSRDLVSYCGCDGKTFQDSSDCATMAYSQQGPCPDDPGNGGIAGGLNCDASQVFTDDLPPECEIGQIPQVVLGGWGTCVPLGDCGCDNPGTQDQCGDGLSYICRNDNRCGDLVN